MEIKFKAYNDYELNVYVWDEVKSPKAVVQIAHGMAEDAARYEDFAKFLNKNGYIVLADDHRAHGKTAQGKLGIVPDGDCYFDTIEDMALLTDYAKDKYKVPVILFGHSYGSFLSQGYIEKHSDKIVACVLCGSAKIDTSDAKLGGMVANLQTALFGKDKPAKFIANLSFGNYEKPFKQDGKTNAWLNRDMAEVDKYNANPMCGFILSLGFYKSFFHGLKQIYGDAPKQIRKDLPIFIISGDQDPVGGMGVLVKNLFEMYKDFGFNVDIKLYEGARHEILNEINKEEVYNDALAFFEAHNK
ncbi:MAG: alpha/beta hydrolase [Clostridiales bacterium]|nr:alpha/beta hydrolase [Clostridiales bacterium]